MNYLTIFLLFFSVLGALDRIAGNHLGIGKEFEKAFFLLGTMALSMIGMIVLAPLIADMIRPFSDNLSIIFHLDASVIPASLLANDMGGAPLAVELAQDEQLGLYNALIVSSMMGCTISFTIPFALGLVNKNQHKELFLGLLCGIITIPIGCLFSGLLCNIPIIALLINLIPLFLFSIIIAIGLIFFPEKSIKLFRFFGILIKCIITIGLTLGIANFLSKEDLIPGLATIEEGIIVCLNAVIVLSGAFPFMYILSKLLTKPLTAIGRKIGINNTSVIGLFSALITNATTFGMMEKMDKKGVVMNAAFCVSAAFIFGSHMAFTLAFDSRYLLPVIVGKLTSGIFALILSNWIYNKILSRKSSNET